MKKVDKSSSAETQVDSSTNVDGFRFSQPIAKPNVVRSFLKPVKELRNQLDFHPQEISSQLKYFIKQNIDWDVYLPTKQKNLQRPLVWTLEQKRELINSVLIGRHIPHCAIVNIVNPNDEHKDILQIIDGKQRLSSLVDFVQNKFTLEIDGKEYLFNELPQDYQQAINYFHFRYYVVNEPWGKPMTDQQKINWFKFINFAGTPQDAEHLRSLSQ